MTSYKTATFFIKNNMPEAVDFALSILPILKEHNIQPLVVYRETEKSIFNANLKGVEKIERADIPKEDNIAIVLGGDGTLLSTARCLFGHNTPVVGINFGHLGFLTEIEGHEAADALSHILKGVFTVEKRPYFTVSITRDNVEILPSQPFINDAVIQRNADERMLTFSVNATDSFVTDMKADGLIIATPTGSTAYNLSAGGPIVSPAVDALILAPICPHTLSFRPIVLPPEEMRLTNSSPLSHLSLDGRRNIELKKGDVVKINKSQHHLTLLHHHKMSFYSLLERKLGWDGI